MDFFGGVKSGVLNTFNFTGRARRMEYWSHLTFIYGNMLFFILIIGQIDQSLNDPAAFEAFAYLFMTIVAVLLGTTYISVSVRRLHDHDMTGFILLLNLVPFGGFYLLYKTVSRGTKGPNRYGPDPLPPSKLETSVF